MSFQELSGCIKFGYLLRRIEAQGSASLDKAKKVIGQVVLGIPALLEKIVFPKEIRINK